MNYYNDNDPRAVAWLKELILARLIPGGKIDDRSILDINPIDLSGYVQHHFFAGIAGWSVALALAGWPSNKPVWTGSCPCQPFSKGGKRLAERDERHLWPAFFGQIAKCQPTRIFGEQVASADGRKWFARVRADLEEVGYFVGAADLCAAGVGAPHLRPRIFWGAGRLEIPQGERGDGEVLATQRQEIPRSLATSHWGHFDTLPFTDGTRRRVDAGTLPVAHGVPHRLGRLRGYGNAIVPELGAQFIQAFEEAIYYESVKVSRMENCAQRTAQRP